MKIKQKQRLYALALACLPLFSAPLVSAPLVSAPLVLTQTNNQITAVETATFEQVLQAAMNHDSEYRAARYTLEGERQEISMARSQLLPRLAFGAGYTYEDTDNIYTDKDNTNYYKEDDVRSSGKIHDNYWRFNIRQPIFDRSLNQDLNRAKNQVTAAEHRYQQVKQQLVFKVADVWLNLLYAQMQVHFSLENLESLDLRLAQAERQDQLGVGDQLELLDISARRDLAQADLLAAQSELSEKLLEIQLMSGRKLLPPAHWVTTAHQLEVTQQPQSIEAWNKQAIGNQAYQEQLARVAMAESTRLAKRAGHYPTLNLDLDYTNRSSDDEFREKEGFTASLNLSLELYGGGRTSSALRQAQARLNAEQAQADKVVLDAQQMIAVAWAKQQNLYQRLQALKNSMLSAEGYQQAATRGETLGLKSQVDVVEANARLFQARERHAEALVAYLLSDLRLHLETGQLEPSKLQEYDQLFNQLNP
ncbi:MAG TPA: TolC family protein [Marinospirillum sp.]|uniref:TolC family protein n=1 Tax=Marinospirillum sp. TaxID=2183934 RepID=UPI002B4616EC|nr:TolC family protein [Marinospirillum sp.]HKM15987.1 TolC family protein [Marinospirillum sp.]